MTAGRPRKLYLQGQARITTSLSVKEEIRDLIPREKKISREFEEFIVWKYGEKEENDLQSLIKQREELLSKLGRIDFDIRDIERRIKDKEEMRKSLKIQEKYKANVLRSLLSKYKAHPPELNSDWLLRTYGISFTVPKGNWKEIAEDIEKMDDSLLIDTFSVKKVGIGQREKEVMQEVLLR